MNIHGSASGSEYNGIWWIPERESDKVAGVLSVQPGQGIRLSLSGTLGDPAKLDDSKSIPIVVGFVWDWPLGNVATLRGCLQVGLNMSWPGISRETYWCERVFLGAHLHSEIDYTFTEATFELSGLPSWASSYTGLSRAIDTDQNSRLRGMRIEWVGPETLVGATQDARIRLFAIAGLSGPRRHQLLKETIRIGVEPAKELTVDAFEDNYLYPLQNFLTLATDHPSAIHALYVRHAKEERPIQVLTSHSHHSEEGIELQPHKMLFTLKDLGEHPMDLIARWIQIWESLGRACAPYFSMQYQADAFVETQFLGVFQSLEAYQRQRANVTTNEAIIDQRHLKVLLATLLEEHWNVVGPLFAENKEATASRLMMLRNFIVHREPARLADDELPTELIWASERLMFLMKACLLAELGFSSEARLNLFGRNQSYSYALRGRNTSFKRESSRLAPQETNDSPLEKGKA